MFDTENFKIFVGPKSAVSYVSGLKRIEQLYDTDIDERFGIDECASLIEKLKFNRVYKNKQTIKTIRIR